MKAICSVLRLVIVAAALLVSDGQALPHNHVHFAPVATLTTANETMAGVGKIPCTVAFKGWMGEEDGTHKDESTGQSVHDKYYHLSGKSTIGCWKSDGSQLKKHVCVVDAVRTPVLTTNTGDGECLRDPDCASGPYEVPIVKSKDDEARLKTESRMDEAKWCMSPNAET
ncbi:unnamed protein product [Vitrella brassicaformis CCMP3155]|uniref:Uncharacterized protein n=1 Tax=Vitrella brassicaformis (strain CCMP3155) TaxID=1169540 RepID=A0A0G4GP45_VITBC|nr:unnamed protein product [Vitrella brassicaformis CCMP3155]|eukprot:CEM32081.1 unnamed protein product [Vitrella brassicaformis CCMP3155]